MLPDIDVAGSTSNYTDDIETLAFSSNGRYLAVGGGFFGSVSTWNVAAPRAMLGINENPQWDIAAIAFSPSGAMIAAGEYDCGLVAICGD